MREIKFRAWHKHQKCMFISLFLTFLGKIGIWNYEETEIDFGSNYDFLELMQFTGLKDRNGVEVYESDIVYWKHLGTYGVVYYNEEEVHYFVKPIKTKEETESYLDSTHMEVKGNIYENPELLK